MTPYHNRFLLRPASREEAGLFYSDDQADRALGTVGHVRMDFGSSGRGFYHTWWPRNRNRFNTPEFKEILQQFVDTLRQDGPLKDLPSMERFCRQNGGAITEDSRSYADREYSMLLEASAGEGQSTLLLLPDSQARLERLLGRAGIQYSSQVRFRVVDSTLPGAVFNRIPVEHLPILGLNRLCQAAERIAPEDLKTLVHLLAGRDQPSHGLSMGGTSM